MELNREIIKALEYCTSGGDCYGCKYDNPRLSREGCKAEKRFDALSLIKELTEENERLRAEVSVKKKLLDKCVDLEDRVKADTVRKMQERLNDTKFKFDGTYYIYAENVDQIAKEMLEEGK